MTDFEKKNLFESKKVRLQKCKNRIANKRKVFISLAISIVSVIVLLAMGIVFLCISPFTIGVGVLLLILVIAFFIFDLVLISSVNKDPNRVAILTKEIADLEKSIERNERIESSLVEKKKESSKLDDLVKYKRLLDDGVITQEEFDKKKSELL